MKRYSFLRFPNFLDKALTLSYDDAVVWDEKLIEIMQKYGLKGTFNANSAFFGYNEKHLTREKAVELYTKSNNEVAIHGEYHYSHAELDKTMSLNDILMDRKNLEQMFGKQVRGMAYANGSYSDEVVEILKICGVKYARGSKSTESFDIPNDWYNIQPTCHHNNPKLMELAHNFIEGKKSYNFWYNSPKLFYLWGHSYEFNNKDNWQVIEEFAKYVGNRDDVWYATNGEIYDYIKAYDSLEFSVDGKIIYNPTCQDVYMCYFEQNIVVPMGETVKVEKLL